MEVGFIGLGNMGSAMAGRLLQAGHAVTVWNRTQNRADQLQSSGARVAKSPADAARTGVVITMVAEDSVLESVAFGENGILKSLPSGGIHISMSTISVALSGRLAEAHRNAGQKFVSAPVLGRPEAAVLAKLLIIAAGSSEDIGRVQPLFDAMGQKTIVVSADPPAANTVKLCCNFFIASTIETLGESFALARKSGIDATKLLEIFTGSALASPVVSSYGSLIAGGKFTPPGFRLPLGLKDMRLVLAAADSAGTPLPVASLLHDRFVAAIGRGHSEKDWSAIALLAAEDAGLKAQ